MIAIDSAAATAAFQQARALCRADAGRLWGVSLCGPMMFVDPQTHKAVANEPVAGARKDGWIYRFTLPADVQIANTSIAYQGRRWIMVRWPLPKDSAARGSLLMHESFHRIQPMLHFAGSGGLGANGHLDTEQGRIWLRAELHALRAALRVPTIAARKAALRDAVAFRCYRRSLFPHAAKEEQSLEINEGLAESTGIDAGVPAPLRIAFTLRDLDNVEKATSYVREFPYGTGPAYGELLDRIAPHWRKHVSNATDLALLAAQSYGISARPIDRQRAQAMLSRYDGAAILAQERARAARIAATQRRYAAEFLKGPTLTLPLKDLHIAFDPRDVEQFGSHGAVYHSLHLSDRWGALEVSGGDALITADFSEVVLPAPSVAPDGSSVTGADWRMTLAAGYTVVAAPGVQGGLTVRRR